MVTVYAAAPRLTTRAEGAPTPATIAELATPPATTEQVTGCCRRHSRGRALDQQTYDVTASLVAARTEADGAIHLVLADTRDPSITVLVELPAPARDERGVPPALRERLRASRHAFVDAIRQPSFEGFDLLYGDARLTLAPLTEGRGPDLTEADIRPLYRVLDFAAIDGGVSTGGGDARTRPSRWPSVLTALSLTGPGGSAAARSR